MSSIVAELRRIYRKHEGIEIVTGLNPFHFGNYRDASFTHYLRDGQSITHHLGISLWEIMILEQFSAQLRPRSIFIVGNGYGWSALALALMNRDADVVVIEPECGIEATNRIAFAERLRCAVVPGFSPADNERVIRQYCATPPDLIFIDGLHSSQQILLDFASLLSLCGAGATYFFHDIINFGLQDGMERIDAIGAAHGMRSDLLACAPSGMAVVYPEAAPQGFRDLVETFGGTESGMALVAAQAGVPAPRRWGTR